MEVAPTPRRGGYRHPGAVFIQAVETQWNALGQPLALTPEERADHHVRDVGASADDPTASVRTDERCDTVTLELDGKTAAVLVYAARLMLSDYDAHAREVRGVAERMPRGSYGHENRLEIATRHERIANRLRAVEKAYQREVSREYWGI